jgi:hypothetical protein
VSDNKCRFKGPGGKACPCLFKSLDPLMQWKALPATLPPVSPLTHLELIQQVTAIAQRADADRRALNKPPILTPVDKSMPLNLTPTKAALPPGSEFTGYPRKDSMFDIIQKLSEVSGMPIVDPSTLFFRAGVEHPLTPKLARLGSGLSLSPVHYYLEQPDGNLLVLASLRDTKRGRGTDVVLAILGRIPAADWSKMKASR